MPGVRQRNARSCSFTALADLPGNGNSNWSNLRTSIASSRLICAGTVCRTDRIRDYSIDELVGDIEQRCRGVALPAKIHLPGSFVWWRDCSDVRSRNIPTALNAWCWSAPRSTLSSVRYSVLHFNCQSRSPNRFARCFRVRLPRRHSS